MIDDTGVCKICWEMHSIEMSKVVCELARIVGGQLLDAIIRRERIDCLREIALRLVGSSDSGV